VTDTHAPHLWETGKMSARHLNSLHVFGLRSVRFVPTMTSNLFQTPTI